MVVLPYSLDALIEQLADYSEADKEYVSIKSQLPFFDKYLRKLSTKTILIEPEYIDKDYLQDFAGYYVSCFHEYRRRTARFHFFSKSFAAADVDQLLAGQKSPLSKQVLQKSYLGFMVVKPLPQTIIGRTCLKTYPSARRRYFPVAHSYAVNLFGLSLSIDSVPFQEQDSVAAACATSALWSNFQSTGKFFHHAIPSPTEITRAAIATLPNSEAPEARAFPSRGLTAPQMANAINAVGLEAQILSAQDNHIVKSTLYAYLRGGVPALMAITLEDLDFSNPRSVRTERGGHAVAVAGYSLGSNAIIPNGPTKFQLEASRIDKFYVHDDQLGPFARMSFQAHEINGKSVNSMSTDWRPSNADVFDLSGQAKLRQRRRKKFSNDPCVIALPTLMVLPLYKKIRIPFKFIHDAIVALDDLFEQIRLQFFPAMARQTWDIYLITVASFKSSLLKDGSYGSDTAEVLKKNLPKFMWRAIARTDDARCLDLLFDATGIEQSPLLLLGRTYGHEFNAMIQALCKQGPGTNDAQAASIVRAMINHFSPTEKPQSK